MRDIPNKIDNIGDELSADEFNSLKNELKNLVTSTDQSLDLGGGPDTDLNMIGKAVAAYSSGGQYYADSGGINNYVLAKSTNLKPVPSYKNGMMVVFKASSVNTGASVINVSTLGSKSLTQFDGTVLDAGQIVTNDYITAIYNSVNDRFELMGSGVSEFSAGTVMLFGNSTAPVGWTRKTDWQDSSMFCYKSSGVPSSGGTVNPQTAHDHSGPQHTHPMQDHTHPGGSHTLTQAESAPHVHPVNMQAPGVGGTGTGSVLTTGGPNNTDSTGGGDPHDHGDTGVPSNNTTGPSGSGNTGLNATPYFQEVLAATKD